MGDPHAGCGDARRDELVAHDGGCGTVEIGERIFLVLTLEIRGVIRAFLFEAHADALVFGAHDAHPFACRAGRVVEHGADAELLRGAKGVQRQAGHRVDEIARLQVRADPTVEAPILPQEKPPGARTQRGGRVFQQAAHDVCAEAKAAQVRGICIRDFPCRIARVEVRERTSLGDGARGGPHVARVRG